jgi:hypothetical protein
MNFLAYGLNSNVREKLSDVFRGRLGRGKGNEGDDGIQLTAMGSQEGDEDRGADGGGSRPSAVGEPSDKI